MLQESNIFKQFLKQREMKCSQPRKTILRIFLQVDGHIEIEELYRRVLEEDDHIGKATVYRTMNLLVECDLAKENILSHGKRYFEKSYRREHHDHLVCTQCGKIEEFHHLLIENFQNEVANQHSFTITSHSMTLFGICPNCKTHNS